MGGLKTGLRNAQQNAHPARDRGGPDGLSSGLAAALYLIHLSTNDYPTMANRFYRLWMFWLVIALQAMTPFIHAHAGPMQLNHAGWIHAHTPISSDAAYPAASTDGNAAGVAVAPGVPLRLATLAVAEEESPCAVIRPAAVRVDTLSVPFPFFPAGCAPPPDHALPLALAPPRR